jgi:hypothetical protein
LKKNMTDFNCKTNKVILQVGLTLGFRFLFLMFYTFISKINDDKTSVKNHCLYTLKQRSYQKMFVEKVFLLHLCLVEYRVILDFKLSTCSECYVLSSG